jgi:tetratricopeptide (TPR) repeat protein
VLIKPVATSVIYHLGQTDFVIDDVFVGRRNELARFKALLGELPTGRRARVLGRSRGQKSGAEQHEAARSRVLLVHGLGGSGKSRLLRRFQEMAVGSLPDSPVALGQVRTVFLDWEDEQRGQPASYAGADGPSLVTVLDAVQRAVVDAFGADAKVRERAGRAFAGYRDGAARMPGYAARFADVIAHSRQAGSPFTSQDAAALAKSLTSVGLTVGGHPAGVLGLSPDQLVASAQATGHLSEAAIRAVTSKKRREIPLEEYDLVTDPARELTRRVAAALRTVAATVPLVVFLDTGEAIGAGAWAWLRRVMTQTGSGVVWLAGARFETEAEAGVDSPVAQFVRDIGDAHLVLMSPARFDDLMIAEYLGSRTGYSYTKAQVDMLARFTRGLPLAVSLAAELLEQGQGVEDVCRDVDDGLPSSVVSRLARRYLIHAEQQVHPPDDPRRDDLSMILGLALSYGDLRSDPDLLAALWDVTDPLAAFQELASRHDFVLQVSRRLHDDVRDTLRIDLLDPYRRARVRAINQRALDLYRNRLGEMRTRWPTLDEQVGNAEFTTAVLAGLWHALWVDNQAGMNLFASTLPVVALVDPDTAYSAANMLSEFESTFSVGQLNELNLLTEPRPAIRPLRLASGLLTKSIPAGRRPAIRSRGLALMQHAMDEPEPMVGAPGDRQVAVMILGERLRAVPDERAVAALQKASRQTRSARMRWVIGSYANHIASALTVVGKGSTLESAIVAVVAAVIATKEFTDNWSVWRTYADALRMVGRFEDALAAYDHTLGLGVDPGIGEFHESKGIVLAAMGRLDAAMAELDTAERLAPNRGGEGRTWAAAILWHRRDADRARARFARVAGRVTGCTAFHTAEMEAVALCGLGEADQAEQRLLDALPLQAPGDLAEPRVIYDLLSDPPLPGIERLRTIVESDT